MMGYLFCGRFFLVICFGIFVQVNGRPQQQGQPLGQPGQPAGQPGQQPGQQGQQAGQPGQLAGQPGQQAGQPGQQAGQSGQPTAGQDPNAQPQQSGANQGLPTLPNTGDPTALQLPPFPTEPPQSQHPATTVPPPHTTTMAAPAMHPASENHVPLATEGPHSQPIQQSPFQSNSPPFTFQIPLPGSGNQDPNQHQQPPTIRFIPLGAFLLSKFFNQNQQQQQHG